MNKWGRIYIFSLIPRKLIDRGDIFFNYLISYLKTFYHRLSMKAIMFD